MSSGERLRDLLLEIPVIPNGVIQEKFTWFWICLAAAGEQGLIEFVSEGMWAGNPRLLEYVRSLTTRLDEKEAVGFESGAHFVFLCLQELRLPYIRVKTIRKFDSELEDFSRQVVSVLELLGGLEDTRIEESFDQAKGQIVTDFAVPTPARFQEENDLLMRFIASRSIAFGCGGAAIYELYKREINSRRFENITRVSK